MLEFTAKIAFNYKAVLRGKQDEGKQGGRKEKREGEEEKGM